MTKYSYRGRAESKPSTSKGIVTAALCVVCALLLAVVGWGLTHFGSRAEPPKTEDMRRPTLVDTFLWLSNTLNAAMGSDFRLENTGCEVKFVRDDEEVEFSLANVDPTTISFNVQDRTHGAFCLATTNNEKTITDNLNGETSKRVEFCVAVMEPKYLGRFAHGFEHAVSLCNGKPSVF